MTSGEIQKQATIPDTAGVLVGMSTPRADVEAVYPATLTPLIAHGAIMEPLALHHDWTKRQLHGNCAEVVLPTKEQAKASLWMDQAIMDGARDYLSYECHDLRIVKVDQLGELSVLICQRTEPALGTASNETAPINGFWWSIGGRREIPKPGSELDGKFSLIDSVLHKARREAGVEPSDVLAIYDLGVGRTEFEREMRYDSFASDSTGSLILTSRHVSLSAPQRTINRNLVVMVNSDGVIADQSVEHLSFMSASEYAKPQIRAQFCDYEQSFLDALFAGWEMQRAEDRRLIGELI